MLSRGVVRFEGVRGLGFCSLAKVNIALLGKQGWHLLTNLDSLMA